jgi:hypothetical protein
MKEQRISEEFKRMQKLAGIINEISNSDEDYDDFMDHILTLAVEYGVLTQRNIDALNRGDAPELMSMLEDLWGEFELYVETGQGISTSDYIEAVNKLERKIYSSSERSRDDDDEDVYK